MKDYITQKEVQQVKEKLNLNIDSKILNISHNACMDGTGSTISLHNCFRNIEYIKAGHKKDHHLYIDTVAGEIDYDKYDAVIYTDISPESVSTIKDIKNVVLLDHHDTANDHHDPDNLRFVYNQECATFLTKTFCSMYFNKDLSFLNELVKYINDYDMWYQKEAKGWALNELHFKMKSTAFVKRFENGNCKFKPEELKYVFDKRNEMNNQLKKVQENYYPLPFNINGCYVEATSFVNDICNKLLNDGFMVVINRNPKTKSTSLRTNNKLKDVHIGNILRDLKLGGGHKHAGGFGLDQSTSFEYKIKSICKELAKFKECVNIR